MMYTRDIIQKRYNEGENLRYIFFWGHHPSKNGIITKSCLSQWYDCKFTVDGTQYSTAEQYMMSQKAVLFGDIEVNEEIMKAGHPNEYKALGRKIRSFDPAIWDKSKTDIVIKGNTAKFSQNPELKKFLLSTGDRVLVEASPYDRIWGIGMNAQTGNPENPFNWNGENLLGFCLMEVREILKNQ